MMPTRPVLRYHGGKWKLAPWIISHFPPHKVYLEPFSGGGSVLLRKPRSSGEILNDLDEVIVEFFRVVRDPASAAELARRVEFTPYARAEFEDWCYGEPTDAIDAAHRLVVRSHMAMSSKGIWQKSGFDTRANGDGFISRVNSLRHAPDTIRAVAARLVGVVIERGDAVTLIERHDREDALIYCDPPYVRSTRGGAAIYKYDMSDALHSRLAEVLCQAKAMVVLSGYPSELYERLYSAWKRVERGHWADGGKASVEVLWLNPAAESALNTTRAA